MKYVVCVPDGCADEPLAELGGRTPLQAAAMPTLAALARRGEVGRAAVIPEGMPPGSDVGNMSILGYDPARYHTGRAPIEAAALGLRLRPDQVAYRCNLVNLGADGTMLDFAGGHPSTEDATKVIEALQAELGAPDGEFAEVSFHPGFQYRHILVVPESWADADCTPPHDLSDKPAVFPTGPSAPKLQALMEASQAIVGASDLHATQIWLWGQGPQPQMTPFREAYGLKAGLVTAVDLIRGLGVLTDIEVVEVEGATGWFDTNYEGKRDAAL
ncbi:MAG: Cofactor-independent phosphoglycerate mutase, partial [Actinomycetia bacterium]|nr:Cofactor-independent phosphoglycerate mutase [Actinomycetes bacterium]